MLEILLIRHGQTDWNRERRIMGRKPIPLNKTGREEARSLARVLKGIAIDAIYTSPVRRAVETAKQLNNGRRVRIFDADEIAEIDYGDWIGKTFGEVIGEKAFHVYYKAPRRSCPPGGEPMMAVFGRTIRFIERLRKRHKNGRVAVVSHADVIKAILVHYLGMDYNHLFKFRIDNASISLLWFHKDRARVLTINSLPTPSRLFDLIDLLSPNLKLKKCAGR